MVRRDCGGLLWAVLLGCALISGCGGGSSTVPLAVATTSLPDGTVDTSYSKTLSASGGTEPYIWSQTSGGAMPPGVSLTSAGVFFGTPTTAGTFGPYVFTVTDSTSATASTGSLSITIKGKTLAVTTSALPNGTVGTPYSTTLAASGGTAPYTWAETSGGAMPPGLAAINSIGVLTGTPTTPGTYGPYVFTVTDSVNATAATASLTITINGTTAAGCPPMGNESVLTVGNPYGFLVKGTDGAGNPIVIAGSFTPNGAGAITNAAVDYNGLTNGPEQFQVNLAGSSYALGSSAQGCLYLAFSGLAALEVSAKRTGAASQFKSANATRARRIKATSATALTVSGVQFSFVLGGFDGIIYRTGRIIESDNTTGTGTNTSGFLHVQTPSAFSLAALQANYAFGVDGWTVTAPGTVRTAIAGTFTNSSGALTAGYADVNVGGTPSGERTGGYGTLDSSVDATTGRGTGTYFLTTPSGPLMFDFAFYILNGTDLILLSTDSAMSDSTTPLVSGRAMASNATYDAGALNGNYLLASQGLEANGSSVGNLSEVGTMNTTSAGTIPTANIYTNDAGTYSSKQYPNSSYAVEVASGRVGFSGLKAATPVVYLTAGSANDDGIVGFLVGTDTEASSGVVLSQTTGLPSFSVANVAGSYAASTAEDLDGLNGAFLGVFAFDGTGGYTVMPQVTGSVPNVPNAGTISVNPDGSGTFDGGTFVFVTNEEVLFAIPVSGDPLLFVFMEGTLPQ